VNDNMGYGTVGICDIISKDEQDGCHLDFTQNLNLLKSAETETFLS